MGGERRGPSLREFRLEPRGFEILAERVPEDLMAEEKARCAVTVEYVGSVDSRSPRAWLSDLTTALREVPSPDALRLSRWPRMVAATSIFNEFGQYGSPFPSGLLETIRRYADEHRAPQLPALATV
jgi:hypothetical protein